MKLVIDIPQGMIDAFSHEEQWTAVLCRDMNTVLQNGTPYEERPKGKWLSHYDYCAKHGVIPSALIAFWWCDQCEQAVEQPTNFCPNCGADMRGDV